MVDYKSGWPMCVISRVGLHREITVFIAATMNVGDEKLAKTVCCWCREP